MDRYTYQTPDGTVLLTDQIDGRYTANEVIDILATRLCAYEDTEISPGELTGLLRSPVYIAACVLNGAAITHERAIEIAKAEVEGRLVVLPCKVGDTIYVVQDTTGFENIGKSIWECKVIGFTRRKSVAYVMFLHTTFHLAYLPHEVSCDDLGIRWFLTHEEAEAALAKEE